MKRVFKVVRCPRCGFLQLTAASKIVRCFSCGLSWQLDREAILFSSPDFGRAREFLAKLKQRREAGFRKASGEG